MKVFFIFILFTPILSFSQITDNFSDGNFTSTPAWSGNDTDFIVNAAQQLQLNSSGTSASYLSLANTQSLNNCEWNFRIRLDFSPSSNNYARVFLTSDKQDLSGNLNGYYLQFGESLANDQVELFRKSGSTSVSVCRGITPIASAFSIRVKVTRSNAGLWQLFVDPAGGTNYVQEASGTDNTFSSTSYFGVYCKYTGTYAADFYFDDFYMYSPPDASPAILDSVKIVSQNKIDVCFNEPLNKTSAQNPVNYSVNNSMGNPSAAVQDTLNPSVVHLTFAAAFTNGQTYTLSVSGIQDLAGNITSNSFFSFLFFIPRAYDIVIHEIMADINPVPNNLPSYEYIELFNRTNHPAKLKGWMISDASSAVVIPDITIQPDSFYVLTSTSGASAFTGIAASGVPSFPSLNDSGDDLILRDENGNIISVVYYTAEWYNDPVKGDGGWSLEQIDPDNPCAGKANWKASADNSGGTPGRKNSVFGSAPDVTAPKISHVTVISPDIIRIYFNEPADSSTLVNPASYTIDKGIGNPVDVNPSEPDYSSVILTFSDSIGEKSIYTITVVNIKDCAGNIIQSANTAQFAIPEPVTQNDIAINEILFDPHDNGVEWVELYNRSEKIIDLKDIFLCSKDNNNNFSEINQIAPNGYLILPQKYIVLSKDANAIKAHYHTSNPEGFINMNVIPAMNNDSDYVLLINTAQQVIDQIKYHSEWHLPMLNDTKGNSLERISFNNPSQDANNWHSASESSGGATPAYKNSQYTDGEEGTGITLSPEVFSPDNDGYNDVLGISYTFDTPGMIGNVHIYDSRGRLEKSLVRNELLGASGTFFWDGITDEKLKARIGIYIIYFEAFDTKGNVKKYKKTCVLGGKL